MKAHLLFFLLLNFSVNAQPGLVWAKGIGGISGDVGYSIALDRYGNVYTAGSFMYTADFDAGPNIHNLTAVGYGDIFICKYDSSGNFIWAKQIGGTGWEYVSSIAVDAKGDVYATGNFMGTVDFNPGPGIYNLTMTGGLLGMDIFICKLNANGDFVWAHKIGGGTGNTIAVDKSSNVFITGYFSWIADFDPGIGTHNLLADGDDAFILKLDSSGNFIWATQIGGSHSDNGRTIDIDDFGNIYTAGCFSGTIDFDPGPGVFNLTSTGFWAAFISKLDNSGNFIWAKQIEPISGSVTPFSIKSDRSGNILLVGTFVKADFDPGAGTYILSTTGAENTFICKLRSDGSFIWAKHLKSNSLYNQGQSLAVDLHGNVYTSGWFTDTTDFDPGSGFYNLISNGAMDLFMSKLDSSGNFQCATSIGGSHSCGDVGRSIVLDRRNNIYMTGNFSGNVDFDAGPGIYNLNAGAGAYDIFISKFMNCQSITQESEIEVENLFSVFPNPSSGIFAVNLKNKTGGTQICIYDLLGNCVTNKIFVNDLNAKIDLSNHRKGIYFVEIVYGDKRRTQKIVLEQNVRYIILFFSIHVRC